MKIIKSITLSAFFALVGISTVHAQTLLGANDIVKNGKGSF